MKRLIFIMIGIILAHPYPAIAEKQTLEAERESVSTLVRRSLGITRRPSIMEWRKSPIVLSALISQPIEFNNYDSQSLGLMARMPYESFLLMVTLKKVFVSATSASNELGKTPFKQPGRPDRYEWFAGADFPFTEGIGNQLFTWIPQVQILWSLTGGLNSLVYPSAFNQPFQDILTGLLSPRLSGSEVSEIQKTMPQGMYLDRSKMYLSAGMKMEAWTKERVQFFLQVTLNRNLQTSEEPSLGTWLEYTLGGGYAL